MIDTDMPVQASATYMHENDYHSPLFLSRRIILLSKDEKKKKEREKFGVLRLQVDRAFALDFFFFFFKSWQIFFFFSM